MALTSTSGSGQERDHEERPVLVGVEDPLRERRSERQDREHDERAPGSDERGARRRELLALAIASRSKKKRV